MKKRIYFKPYKILMGGGLLLLSSISVFGIGYSGWNVEIKNNINNDINIDFDDLIVKQIFTIENIDMFSLGKDGLVEDYTIVKKAHISINIKIDNLLAYDFAKEGQLSFHIALKCSNTNFISSFIDKTPVIESATNLVSNINENIIHTSLDYLIETSGYTHLNLKYNVLDNGEIKNYCLDKPNFSFEVGMNI